MNFNSIVKSASNVARYLSIGIKNYSPDIMTYSGIAGFIGTVAYSCYATKKVCDMKLISKTDELIFNEYYLNKKEEYSTCEYGSKEEKKELDKKIVLLNSDHEKDLKAIKKNFWCYTIRKAVPGIMLGGASIACLCGGHIELKNRYYTAIASYEALNALFNNYRQRVVDEEGIDADNRYLTNSEKAEDDFYISNNIEEIKDLLRIVPDEFIFDKECDEWDCCGGDLDCQIEYGRAVLQQICAEANYTLQRRYNSDKKVPGYYFLRELYELLGYNPSKNEIYAAEHYGWVYDPNRGYSEGITFGSLPTMVTTDNKNVGIKLKFNLNGNIMQKIFEPKKVIKTV